MVTPRADSYAIALGSDVIAGDAFSAPPPPPPPPPPPAPSIVLSSDGAATVGVAETLTVAVANITGPVAVTVARVSGPAATISPVPTNHAPGELTRLAFATAAAVGTLRLQASATIGGSLVQSNAVDLVVSGAPTPPPPPPPPAPTLATLSISPSATQGVPTPFAVSLNAPADQAYVVTPSFAGSPTLTGLTGGTVTIPAGQTTHAAVTASWASAGGPHAVDFTISPSLTRAGRPASVTVSAPVAAGTWQVLSVAPHSRKTSNLGPGDGNILPYDPTKAIALDNAPITPNVTVLPAKGWNKLIQGEHGAWYLGGGMHSNYPGSEVERVTLPTGSNTTMQTELDVQPFRSPEGVFSGYFSGGCGYVHRQYNVPMADPSDWRPYVGHQWTMATWHPDWGLLIRAPHPLQTSYPNGAYVLDGQTLVSSHAQPADTTATHNNEAEYRVGYVSLNWETKKWTTRFPNLATGDYGGLDRLAWVGHTGAGDWNEFSNSLLFICTGVSGRTELRIWHRSTNTLQDLGFTTQLGGDSGTGENGVLVSHLEGEKYLLLRRARTIGPAADSHRLMLYNRRMGTGSAQWAQITIPAWAFTNADQFVDVISFRVDRNSRRVFWLIRPGGTKTMRYARSTFDDLSNWTELTIAPARQSVETFIDAWKQPLMFRDGYLYLQDTVTNAGPYGWPDGSVTMRRAKVDNGEDLPPMSYTRYDYDLQNFAFSHAPFLGLRSVKHSNWASRTTTGEHILCGGDLGGNYNGSMARLTFSGNGPGQYQFTEILSEVAPAPLDGGVRMRRPSSPDDGAWWYSGSSNPNPAFRDKFIFMRGGDGIGLASNPLERQAYRNPAWTSEIVNWDANINVEVNCPLHVAAMQADGWTIERLLVYDPDKGGFISTGVASWPVSSGAWPAPHPTTLSSSSSRCGVFDVATNCAFRITLVAGTLGLVRYDLTNQTIRIWNIGTWTDTAGIMGPANRLWFTAGPDPALVGHANDVLPNGFGFQDLGDSGRWKTAICAHWEHKALWIDSRDGRLYGVSPSTGYLWCFETRGAETSSSDGLRIPFYPVGNRIPLVGTYPALSTLRNWPPVLSATIPQGDYRGNGDVSMNSFLVPFKGGLLWWSSAHHDQGTFGRPLYCFWRRLGFTGDWTVVTTPLEFAANSYSCRTHEWDNDEVVMLSGGGNSEDDPRGAPAIPAPRQKYFWRLR